MADGWMGWGGDRMCMFRKYSITIQNRLDGAGSIFKNSFMGHGHRWLAGIHCPSPVARGQLRVNHIAVALESHVGQTS